MKKVILCFCGSMAAVVLMGILLKAGHAGGYLYVLLLFLFLCAGTGIYFSIQAQRIMDYLMQEKKKRKGSGEVSWDEGEDEKLNLIKKRMEISYLQYQINPHFLYNTLDSIRSRALVDGQAEIAKMTEILSRFFRYCINSSDTLVTVQEELEHIRDYYYIQKYRFGEKLNLQIELEEEEINKLYLPKMTLQPVVENAIVHGLEKVEHKGEIRLWLYKTQRKLVIVVSDNGAGMNREALIRLNEKMENIRFKADGKKGNRTGIALNNTNVRLKMIFGEESGIHYRSMPEEGTEAMVTLPAVDVFARVKYEQRI